MTLILIFIIDQNLFALQTTRMATVQAWQCFRYRSQATDSPDIFWTRSHHCYRCPAWRIGRYLFVIAIKIARIAGLEVGHRSVTFPNILCRSRRSKYFHQIFKIFSILQLKIAMLGVMHRLETFQDIFRQHNRSIFFEYLLNF